MSYFGPITRNLDPVINYISNGDATDSTNGWFGSNEGPGSAIPTSGGVGGTLNGVTFTRSTTTPLRGAADFVLTKDAVNRQGQGVAYEFEIDNADKAKVLTVSFDYEILSGTFATGAVTVWLVSPTELIQPAGYQVQGLTVGTKGRHIATFQTDSVANSYRLLFYISTASASAFSIAFDNVVVGPQVVQYGAPATDWVSYTPTIVGFGTATNVSAYSRRVGDTLEVQGHFTAGTPTATQAQVTLGFNGANSTVTVDTSKVKAGGIVGTAGQTGFASTYFGMNVLAPASNQSYINFGAQSSGAAELSPVNGTYVVAGVSISFKFAVPIVGWSSTVQMSNDTDTRVVAARAVKTADQSIPNNTLTKVTLSSASFDTHSAFDFTNNRYVIQVPGFYRVSALFAWATVAAGARSLRLYKNGSVESEFYNTAGSSVTGIRHGGSATVSCVAGDYLEMFAFQDSGSPVNISGSSGGAFNYFNAERLSGPSAIAASETVAMLYTNTAGTTIPLTTDTTIPFATKVYDTHGSYNTTTGIFTAPVGGKYQVNCALLTNTLTLGTGARFRTWLLNNSTAVIHDLGRVNGTGAANNYATNGSVLVQLLAGQELIIKVNSSVATTLNVVDGNNQLSIVRVGN